VRAPTATPVEQTRPVRPGLVVAAMFLVALNLRAAIASVPPLLDVIEHEAGLSGGGAGALTALPVVCMGAFAVPAHRLAQRWGREAACAGALVLLGVGLLLRLAAAAPLALFASTLLAGIGIAICGVVLPGVVKDFFPDRAGVLTGVYLTAMALGAAGAAALAVPLADRLGSWQESLAAWGVLTVVGLAAWVPLTVRVNEHGSPPPRGRERLPWRSATAWLVTGYLAVQSFIFYSQLSWISPSYEARGWSPTRAGLLLSVFMLLQLGAALLVPSASDQRPDRRPWFALSVGASVVGILALLLWPETLPWVFVAVLGFGQGGGFALGLVLLVDHARDAAGSSRLSAMAFTVGYGLAAVGPFVLGLLRDATDGFAAGWVLLLVLAGVQAATVVAFSPQRRAGGVEG
jgi:MFS transporter, CP family, cyanate transporter